MSNLRANAVLNSVLLAYFALSLAFVSILTSFETDESLELVRMVESSGGNIVVVYGDDRTQGLFDGVSASRCSSLTQSSGVIAGGSLIRERRVATTLPGTASVEVVEVSQGGAAALVPELASLPTGAFVASQGDDSLVRVADQQAARRLLSGLGLRSWSGPARTDARLESVAGRSLWVTGDRLALVEACLIEVEWGYRASMTRLAREYLALPSQAVRVEPARIGRQYEVDPRRLWESRNSRRVPYVVAASAQLIFAAVLARRRPEFALQRSFGIAKGSVAAALLVEFLALLLLGAAVALVGLGGWTLFVGVSRQAYVEGVRAVSLSVGCGILLAAPICWMLVTGRIYQTMKDR